MGGSELRRSFQAVVSIVGNTRQKHLWWRMAMPLGLPYAALLMCSAIGPSITRFDGSSSFFSTLISAAVIVGLILPMWRREETRVLPFLMTTAGAIALFFSSFADHVLRGVLLAISGLAIGRSMNYWALSSVDREPSTGPQHTWAIAFSLQFAYAFLYIANAVVPVVPAVLATVFPAALLFLAGFAKLASTGSGADTKPHTHPTQHAPSGLQIDLRTIAEHWRFPLAVALIFMGASFAYAGMNPVFHDYGDLDRFVNVLPMVLIVPLAAVLLNRGRVRLLLVAGIMSLALAFVLVQFTPSVAVYISTQILLQTGWGFLNVLNWVLAADVERNRKASGFQRIGMAAFMAGITAGSSLLLVIHDSTGRGLGFTDLISFLSLMGALLLIPGINQNREGPKDGSAAPASPEMRTVDLRKLSGYDELSDREREIARLLAEQVPNKDICEVLHISVNTLKTHSRNIYRKLDIRDRKDLRRLLND